MNINEKKLAIYESCDNGEITVRERDALLGRLYESSDSENITLEEAMDTISEVLEASTKEMSDKKFDKLTSKYDKAATKADKAKNKLASSNRSDTSKFVSTMRTYGPKADLDSDALNSAIAKDLGGTGAHSYTVKKSIGTRVAEHRAKSADKKQNKLADRWKSEYEKRNAKTGNKLVAKESVDALRLQVYEACDMGAISESEKYEFLEYLNLENYE